MPRDFDLLISYYGKTEGKHRESAEYYEMRPGPKWPCIGELLAENAPLIDQYDAFWFPDDDLEASTANINRMFAFFHAYEMALAQPALTRDSYFTWSNLLQEPEYQIRFVRFVEVMAPIFDRAALKSCLKTFTESRSGWGLDWLWPQLCGKGRHDKIGIIDAAPVKHTRPLGGDLYKNNPDMDPSRDEQAILQRYGLEDQRIIGRYALLGGVQVSSPAWHVRVKQALRAKNAKRLQKRRQANAGKRG
jgi:Protein of unknown function (DUF707)